MPGYGSINQGYNEAPGINWGKIGAYTAGGALAAGVIGAGSVRARNALPGISSSLKKNIPSILGYKGGTRASIAGARRHGGKMMRSLSNRMNPDSFVGKYMPRGDKIGMKSFRHGIFNGMRGMGYGGLGYFSGAGFKGAARAGVAGTRMGLAAGAMPLADGLNPFSFGWND